MIKAKFRHDKDTHELTMRVTGHSGAAKRGEDLICAAASILAFTAAQEITDLYADGRLEGRPEIRKGSGRMVITVLPKPDAYAEVLHALYILQKGFVLLAANNPKYVKVSPFTDVSEPEPAAEPAVEE